MIIIGPNQWLNKVKRLSIKFGGKLRPPEWTNQIWLKRLRISSLSCSWTRRRQICLKFSNLSWTLWSKFKKMFKKRTLCQKKIIKTALSDLHPKIHQRCSRKYKRQSQWKSHFKISIKSKKNTMSPSNSLRTIMKNLNIMRHQESRVTKYLKAQIPKNLNKSKKQTSRSNRKASKYLVAIKRN